MAVQGSSPQTLVRHSPAVILPAQREGNQEAVTTVSISSDFVDIRDAQSARQTVSTRFRKSEALRFPQTPSPSDPRYADTVDLASARDAALLMRQLTGAALSVGWSSAKWLTAAARAQRAHPLTFDDPNASLLAQQLAGALASRRYSQVWFAFQWPHAGGIADAAQPTPIGLPGWYV